MTTQTPGTIDDANTALAVARTAQERLLACEALIAAAEKTARSIRAAIAATGAPITPAMLRELRSLDASGEPTDPIEWHAANALWFYAREKVLDALVRRDLVRHEFGGMVLTDAGRAAIRRSQP